MRSTLLISVVSLQLAIGICHVCHAAGVTIIENGVPKAAIYADPAVMSEERRGGNDAVQREAEKDRVRLRESVKDLSGILKRISGAKFPIHTDPPPRRSETVAILVGKPAEERIGRPKKRNQFRQGWRLYVGRKGVGFIGESDYVNGKHIKYVVPDDSNPSGKKGEVVDAFQNYAIPGTLEITSAVKPGEDNQVTIAGKRGRLFELGTGGLVGPVYIYCEK